MDKFVINGGNKLKGEVVISGAKNAILPIMTAALLAKGKSTLHNVPYLNDIKMMSHLLRVIGAKVDFENNSLNIDASHADYYEAPQKLVHQLKLTL